MANHPNRATVNVLASAQGVYTVLVGGRQGAVISNNGYGRWILVATNEAGARLGEIERDVTSVFHNAARLKTAIREFLNDGVTTKAPMRKDW